MLGLDQPSHWLIIVALIAVFFGYKKLPDAARSVGRSLRIFKTEMKGMTEDDQAREAAKVEPVPEVPVPPIATDVVPAPEPPTTQVPESKTEADQAQ